MYISRVVIRNFRNFELADAPLHNGANCVIGENNTGKTNFIHALRLPLDANLSSFNRQLRQDDFPAGTDFATPQHLLVSLEFADFVGHPNQEALVADWATGDNVARLTFRFRPRRIVRSQIASGERTADNIPIDDYGWEIVGGGDGIDPLTVIWNQDFGISVRFEELQQAFLVVLMRPLRDVEQELRQSRTSPLGRLLTVAAIPEDEQAELVALLAGANDEIASRDHIRKLGVDITDAFSQTAGEAFKLDVEIGMASPCFSDISRSLNVLLSSGAMKRFEPDRNGLGLNNILYISMLLKVFEHRMASDQTAGQLLLVEEPEAHLHPQLQRVLYDTLSEKAFQTISTTHSAHIASQVPLASVLVLSNDGTGKTASFIPARAGLTLEETADIERFLDVTRATLLFARKVLLVEGPAELYIIPALVKQVLEIDLAEYGVSVIPIFGTHFGAYAKLFGPNAIRKKCAIITDGDLEPAEAPGGEEDLAGAYAPELLPFENAFLKTFVCATTFERAATLEGTLPMFVYAAQAVGAVRNAANLQLPAGISWTDHRDKARRIVLSTAENCGKGRFAQIAARYVGEATEIPRYIKDAVNWLMEP